MKKKWKTLSFFARYIKADLYFHEYPGSKKKEYPVSWKGRVSRQQKQSLRQLKGRVFRQQENQSVHAAGKAGYPRSRSGRVSRQATGKAGYPGSRKGRISRQRERQDIHAAERQGFQAVVKAGHSGSRKGRISRQQERQDI